MTTKQTTKSTERMDKRSRKEQIIEAARELYEERGLGPTSVQAIADKLGVARSLLYHYFPNKDAITKAVFDSYAQDYIEALNYWDAERVPGDIEGSLDSMVRIMRQAIFDKDSFHQSLVNEQNAALYISFVNLAAERLTNFFCERIVPEYESLHTIRIHENIYETMYVLIIGVISYIRSHPDVDNEVVKNIIAQSLHLDRGHTLDESRAWRAQHDKH